MTRHRCGQWLVMLAACLVGLMAGVNAAFAQSAQIPSELRTSANLTQGNLDDLSKIISAWVGDLQSTDPVVQGRARELIVDGIRDQGQTQNTATYRSAYSRLLNAALVAIPADAPIRTRLNAAIVTARVAELARNNGLLGATRKYLADDAMPVALWGMKAARWLLPFEASSPLFAADNPLLNAIPAALKKHPGGAMHEEAYVALALELFNSAIPKPPPGSIGIVVPVVQQTIANRTAQGAAGDLDQPMAEMRGFNFLAAPEVYRATIPPQRLATAQTYINHLDVTARDAIAAKGVSEKSMYIQLLNDMGGVALVIGANEGASSLQTAAENLRQLQINSTPDQITAAVSRVQDALRAVPAFKGLAPTANQQPQDTNGALPSNTNGSVAGG